MHVMKIRRVGNSNVVSLPHVLEQLGYTVGTTVLIAALPDGALHIVPTERVRAVMQNPDPPVGAERHDVPQHVADAERDHAVALSSTGPT